MNWWKKNRFTNLFRYLLIDFLVYVFILFIIEEYVKIIASHLPMTKSFGCHECHRYITRLFNSKEIMYVYSRYLLFKCLTKNIIILFIIYRYYIYNTYVLKIVSWLNCRSINLLNTL